MFKIAKTDSDLSNASMWLDRAIECTENIQTAFKFVSVMITNVTDFAEHYYRRTVTDIEKPVVQAICLSVKYD